MTKMTKMTNKKAYYDYEIIKTFEAGLVLTGPEVKSLRANKANLKGSYCRFFKNELFVFDMHISKYENGYSYIKQNETQERKLLLNKKELLKIYDSVTKDGLTCVPLKIYLANGKFKLEIAIAKGKKLYDKRHSEKEKTIKRDLERI